MGTRDLGSNHYALELKETDLNRLLDGAHTTAPAAFEGVITMCFSAI
jgi:hypothetical protein